VSPPPAALGALRQRAAELSDLGSIGLLLFWDRSTYMPPRGADGRAEAAGTLERVHHERLTDPQVARWLDEAERWAAGEDPESAPVREIALLRRDHAKAVEVPADLAAELARAAGRGETAWLEAREADDFSRLRDALEHHLELRHRYVACFDGFEHPYDALLDDYEPGARTATLRPLFEELREGLVPLVAAAGDPAQPRNGGVLDGAFPPAAQEAALRELLGAFGFGDEGWRLDPTEHPFAQALDAGDVRITTKYDPHDLGVALYSVLHEFGHGMYDANVDPALRRTAIGKPDSLGLHESQSRMWENELGRSEAFCRWMLPILGRHVDLGGLTPERCFWGVNTVQPSHVRIFADETTYNLHIVLRFELELALMEGKLAVADLPDAWADGMQRLFGLEVRSDNEGVLQDIHWGAGLIGYFPTYSLGNLNAAQLWERMRADLPDLDEHVERGEFGPLLGWLRDRVHRHGRSLEPAEVLRRATGQELSVEPFLRYLRGKLEAAGVLSRT
jgi:carboxypeptidase Taq